MGWLLKDIASTFSLVRFVVFSFRRFFALHLLCTTLQRRLQSFSCCCFRCSIAKLFCTTRALQLHYQRLLWLYIDVSDPNDSLKSGRRRSGEQCSAIITAGMSKRRESGQFISLVKEVWSMPWTRDLLQSQTLLFHRNHSGECISHLPGSETI